jgi:hypothetical protein
MVVKLGGGLGNPPYRLLSSLLIKRWMSSCSNMTPIKIRSYNDLGKTWTNVSLDAGDA